MSNIYQVHESDQHYQPAATFDIRQGWGVFAVPFSSLAKAQAYCQAKTSDPILWRNFPNRPAEVWVGDYIHDIWRTMNAFCIYALPLDGQE